MFDKFAYTHNLAREPELCLDRGIRGDSRWRVVGAIKIPSVEPREVLKGSKDLIAADYINAVSLECYQEGACYPPVVEEVISKGPALTRSCDISEIVRNGWVIDETFRQHLDRG